MTPDLHSNKGLNSYRVNASYHEMELAGKDGRPVECLVYVANVFDIIIRDLDTQVEDGSFKFWPLVCNKGDNIMAFKIGIDFGQGTDKATIREYK